MAIENPGQVYSIEADQDLRTAQYKFVRIDDGTGKLRLALGAVFAPLGVLQNKPNVGQAATVWGLGSISKVVVADAITAGDDVTNGDNGTQGAAVGPGSNRRIIGKALTAGNSEGAIT